jgi:hypothetical protein
VGLERGDLHTHSTYTDGRSSIEEMARKAGELGLSILPSPTIRGASRWRTGIWQVEVSIVENVYLDAAKQFHTAQASSDLFALAPLFAQPRPGRGIAGGVRGQAQRGWIEADEVLNTRPLKSLRQR